MEAFANLTAHQIASLVIVILIAALWLRVYREPVHFHLRRWMDMLPLIGNINVLQRNPALRVPVHPSSVFTRAEVNFVGPYARFIGRMLDRSQHENQAIYIGKCEDLGIDPYRMPLLETLALALTILEGWSMAFNILPWMNPQLSADERSLWAAVLGYGLAALFYVFARKAGSMMRKGNHTAPHIERWHEDGCQGELSPSQIGPGADQSMDDQAPRYEQFKARSTGFASRRVPIVIMGVLMLFGVMTTTLRFVDQQREATRQATFQASMAEDPSAVQAVTKTLETGADAILAVAGSSVAIGIFLLSFIAVQILGFVAGYQDSFNGDRSKEAYELIKGKITYEAYAEIRDHRISQLERSFAVLQGGLIIRGRATTPSVCDVLQFLSDQSQQHEMRQVQGVLDKARSTPSKPGKA